MRISSVYGVPKKIHQNKKVFQLKVNFPRANRCIGSVFGGESQVNTFEQVHVVAYLHVVLGGGVLGIIHNGFTGASL